MAKRIFKDGLSGTVAIGVYKDGGSKPIYKGVANVSVGVPLSFSIDITVFIDKEAVYGDLANYTIKLLEWKD